MMKSHAIRMIRCFCVIAMILALPALGGYGVTVPILQPYQVSSDNGAWLLDVQPSHRYGKGPSTAKLIRKETGEIAWKQELPFTFWQCCVSDEGHVGGYAYSNGPMGSEPRNSTNENGEFLVRILDPSGKVKYSETTDTGSIPSFYEPNYYASWLDCDSSGGKMVIVMNNGTLRIYNLRQATLLSAIPSIKSDNTEIDGGLMGMRLIEDSEMALLKYGVWDTRENDETFGFRFVLIDFHGRVIWSLDKIRTLPKTENRVYPKFAILSEDITNEDKINPFSELDPLTPVSVAKFELFLGDSGEKVTYHLKRTIDEHNPKWSVTEEARAKHELPMAHNETLPEPPQFPEVDVKKLGEVLLELPNKAKLGNLSEIVLGLDGRIHVIEEETKSLHVFDKNGKFLHTCQTHDGQQIASDYSLSIAVASSGHILAKKDDPSSLIAKYLRFDTDGKQVEGGMEFHHGEADRLIARHTEMSFIGYGNHRGASTISSISFDGHDNSSFNRITHRMDGQWLDIIFDIATSEDGTITVRESSFSYASDEASAGFSTPFPRPPSHLPPETINLYDKNGNPIRTIDFTKYDSLKEIAMGGGHIIATGNFEPKPIPRVYVFTDDGTPVGCFDADIPANNERYTELRLFVTSGGKEIVVADLASAKILRYEMPKP